MDDVSKWTDFIRALGDLKWPAIFLITLLAGGYATLRVYQTRSSNARSRARDKVIDDLTSAVQSQLNHFQVDLASKAMFDNTLDDIRDTLKDVKARFDGKINKTSSLKVIQSKFDTIAMSIGLIVERSLNYNHYDEQADYIATKIKTDIGDILLDARDKLGRLDLTVNYEVFFRLQPEPGVERFWLADDIWLKIEPLFRGTTDVRQRIERSRLVIKNAVTDYVARATQQSARDDMEMNREVQNAAFERNKRFHDTGKVAPQ